MVIVLDPDGYGGNPEIAYLTGHTSASGTATILRGQEGTTARAHIQDTPWVHSAAVTDFEFCGCRAYRTTNTSNIVTSTATVIGWEAEFYDTHSLHDTSSNTSRFTATTAGYYRLTAQARISIASSGQSSQLYIYKNGTRAVIGPPIVVSAAVETWPCIDSGILQLVTGDYLEVFIVHNSTAAPVQGSSTNVGENTFATFQRIAI